MIKQKYLILFAFALFFLGFYLGSNNEHIDYSKRTDKIVSCTSFEDDFLYSVGFNGKEDCRKFNLELYEDYAKNCSEVLTKTNDSSYDKKALDSCVYYSFVKSRTSLNTKYYVFKHKTNVSGANHP